MVGQAKGQEGDRGRHQPPHPKHPHREDQQQKDVEQGPGREPIPIDPVGPEEREHPPAGRQGKRDVQAIGVGLPAGGRERGRSLGPADCLNLRAGCPDFDAGRPVGRVAGDQLPLAVNPHHFQLMASGGIQTGDLAAAAGDSVFGGDAPAVVVEPELAGKLELIGLPQAATGVLDDPAEWCGGLPAKHRQAPPGLWKRRQVHVHRHSPLELRRAKLGPGPERHQLVGDRGGPPLAGGQFPRVCGAEGIDPDPPRAGPDLGLEPALRIDGDRDRPFHIREQPARRQDAAEILLAAAT